MLRGQIQTFESVEPLSLKAKIEAVIYASEEPVTLVQLVGLLAMEGQAELDRLDDRQGRLGLDGGGAQEAGSVGDEAGPEESSPQWTLEDDAEVHKGGLESAQAVVEPTSESPDVGHLAGVEEGMGLGVVEPTSEGPDVGHPAGAGEGMRLGVVEPTSEGPDVGHLAGVEEGMGLGVVEPTSEGPDVGHPAGAGEGMGLGVVEPTSEGPDVGHPAGVEEGTGLGVVEPTSEGPDVGHPISEVVERRAAKEKERRLREFFRGVLEELIREYATGDRGIEVREVGGGFRMATKPEYHDAVRGFVRSLKPVLKLSLQALETLAVVAYKQPVTAPEVSEIRGVDSGGVLGSLLGRKLISTAGRKQVIGRPILYKTTKDFLLRFGLKDISELPSIEEFEKMAGDFVEQEEIFMPQGSDSEDRITHENLEEEKAATEPQADGDSDDLNVEDSNRPDDEMPALDGRISGLDPTYDKPGDDPSADEARIQEGEE